MTKAITQTISGGYKFRKPGLPSRLGQLPLKQRQQIRHWLVVDKLTYEKVVPMIKDQFGITISSRCLTKFWDRFCTPHTPVATVPANRPLLEISVQVLPANRFKIRVLNCNASRRIR